MRDERRRQEVGEEDFGGGDELREEEGSNLVESDGETVSVSSSNKRIKENSIDRLSLLPDALLIHILSLLWSMEKAAATSVLSKRWKYLWTDLPKLNFSKRSADIEKTRKLVSRAHGTLVLRSVNYLDEFVISFAYDKCFASDVNVWIEFAVINKVKQLRLELHSYMLMYTCSSLTRLSMQQCIVAPQGTVDWESLTELSIWGVELHEFVIQKILAGCPILRTLNLIVCWGFEFLDIDTQSLQHLSIPDCEDGALLEISAPYLHSLDVSSFPIGRKKLRPTNIPSLMSADEEMYDTMDFFEDDKHGKELILGCQCFEVLSKLAENGWQLPQLIR